MTDLALQALQGVNAGRSCDHCGQPVPASRQERKYCSASCRVRACRHRQAWRLLALPAVPRCPGCCTEDQEPDPICGGWYCSVCSWSWTHRRIYPGNAVLESPIKTAPCSAGEKPSGQMVLAS